MDGTELTYVCLVSVDTPRQLRRQAEHCLELADSQFDARTRLILATMASEFAKQADDAEASASLTLRGADSAR